MSEKKRSEKKQEKELKIKIKEFEERKRAEAMQKVQEVKTVTPAGEEDKVSFDLWWSMVNKKAGLKPWMKEIIKADFTGRNLSSKETLEKFNWGLRQFGYNI